MLQHSLKTRLRILNIYLSQPSLSLVRKVLIILLTILKSCASVKQYTTYITYGILGDDAEFEVIKTHCKLPLYTRHNFFLRIVAKASTNVPFAEFLLRFKINIK